MKLSNSVSRPLRKAPVVDGLTSRQMMESEMFVADLISQHLAGQMTCRERRDLETGQLVNGST